MAIYCKKIINEALFEVQLGSLTACSRIVNDPQPIPPIRQRETQPVNTLQDYNNYPESLNPPTSQPENQPVNVIQRFNYPESPETAGRFFRIFDPFN